MKQKSLDLVELEGNLEDRIETLEKKLEELGNKTPYLVFKTLMVNYKLLKIVNTDKITDDELNMKIRCLSFKV